VVASLPAELDDAPLKGESEVDACVYENGVTTKTDAPVSPPDTEIFPGNPSLTTNAMPKSVKDVLDLHTSRRMRPPSPSKGQNHGVSIQSQRRWLYYWSLLLAHEAPSQIWPLCPTPGKSRAQVSLRHLKLQMREPSGVSMGFVEVVSKVIESANLGKEGPKGQGRGRFWASVARYDDQLMHVLEKWERQTRHDSGNLGKRRNYSDCAGNDRPSTIFEPGKWDTEKMVKTVARLGAVSGSLIELGNGEKVSMSSCSRPLVETCINRIRSALIPYVHYLKKAGRPPLKMELTKPQLHPQLISFVEVCRVCKRKRASFLMPLAKCE
jgi:phosphatidylinositol-3,4,5-trisphosphate 3-phosphatase/dual-specificity protein phosphatase PTEN